MSRFDEAMERARAARSRRDVNAVFLPEGTPALEMFEAAWRVRDDNATPTPTPTPAPASPPRPAVARHVLPVAPPPVECSSDLRLGSDLHEKIVSDAATSTIVVEQFRSMAARLEQWRGDRGCATLMVCSATVGEGRTLTALNLALSLRSSQHLRVLVIDADLLRPSLHDVLQLALCPGLGDALLAGRPVAPVEVSARLAVLTSGRPIAPPGAAALTALIDSVRGDYDWIVLDTSAVTEAPVARLLASLVDGVVLVVAAGRTSRHVVDQAVAQIPRERLIGLVLNGVALGDMDAAERRRYRSQR